MTKKSKINYNSINRKGLVYSFKQRKKQIQLNTINRNTKFTTNNINYIISRFEIIHF